MLPDVERILAFVLLASNLFVREEYVVTAYTDWNGNQPGQDRITASGHTTGPGVCAVPLPQELPFGTVLHVEGYGLCTVLDICPGCAEHGVDLDVWFASRDAALQWGRRTAEVVRMEGE